LTHNHRGFSLIELAIVLIIVGSLMAGAILMHKNYERKSDAYRNKENIELIEKALMRFYGEYGRYPCPASMSAAPGDPLFGVASDCGVSSVRMGNCNDHYCVVEGENGQRVRVGSLPFIQLKEGIDDSNIATVDRPDTKYTTLARLEKYEDADILITDDGKLFSIGAENTVDTHKNRFTYAVTERQATDNYREDGGDIRVISENYYSSPMPVNILHDEADFVFFSHGRDGLGARTFYGTPTSDCTGHPKETENCDFLVSNDAVFLDALRSERPGANYYDDTLVHLLWLEFFHWKKDPDNTDAYNLNQDGRVAVGLMNPDPVARLHVHGGNFLAYEKLMTEEICDENGNFCFDPELIGGDDPAMDCEASNPFSAMIGISEGQAVCEEFFTGDQDIDCPGDSYLYGFHYDQTSKELTPLCDDPNNPIR